MSTVSVHCRPPDSVFSYWLRLIEPTGKEEPKPLFLIVFIYQLLVNSILRSSLKNVQHKMVMLNIKIKCKK